MRSKSILYILGLILIGTLNFSCTDEIDGDGGSVPAPQGEAYFSLDVNLGNLAPSTRSGDVIGDPEELKIHSVRVVLYGEEKPNVWWVKYAFEFQINSPDKWGGNISDWVSGKNVELGSTVDNVITPSGQHLYSKGTTTYDFVTFAQRVEKRPYKMLVIINGAGMTLENNQSTIYDLTKKNCTLVQLNNAIEAEVDASTGVIEGSGGILLTNHQGPVEVKVSDLYDTADDANKHPVTVNVDRLVAKVTVKHINGFQFPEGIDKNSVTWGLGITNKKTYWMRRMIGAEDTTNPISMANLYAEDPNYSPKLDTDADLEEQFNNTIITEAGDVRFLPTMISNPLGKYEYVLENTISAVTVSDNQAYLNQATHVILGYKYTPSGFSSGESFYIYKNTVISQTEMTHYKNGSEPIPAALTGLKDDIDEIVKEGKFLLDGKSPVYYESMNIRFCPQGQLYYSFPIRHFNQSEGALGYYGVVRNNIYDITVESLTPPEVAGPFLSARVHIQPWSMHGQSNTIGVSVTERVWVPLKVYHWFNDINLYEEWTYKKGLPVKSYETHLERVGTNMSSENYRTVGICSNLGHGAINFTYSIPTSNLRIVNGDNRIDLFYTQGYILVSVRLMQEICFVDDNGRILKVVGTSPDDGTTFTNNPGMEVYSLIKVKRIGDTNDDGYIFVRNVYEGYKLRITDPNNDSVEYEISDAIDFTRFYETNSLTSTHVVFGTKYTDVMPEPIMIAANGGLPLGGRGIAIFCKRKQ